MTRRTTICFGLAVLLSTAATLSLAAPPPNALDLPPSNIVAPPDLTPNAPNQPEKPRGLSGNPLWAIPLSTLSATRERPLFSPLRRPPAPPAVANVPPAPEPVAVVPAPTGPERPPLVLVGAVVGQSGGIAIFIDQTTNEVVRLKIGESHSGWTLRSIKGREALFQKDRETITLAMPAPGTAPPPGMPAPPGKEPEL